MVDTRSFDAPQELGLSFRKRLEQLLIAVISRDIANTKTIELNETGGDSGYGTRTAGTSYRKTSPEPSQKPIYDGGASAQPSHVHMDENEPKERGVMNQNEAYMGARYQFSIAPTLSHPGVGDFISEMARALIGALPPSGLDDSIPERLALVLPRILESFALMIGHRAPTSAHQEVMVFANQYQRFV